MLYGIFQTNFEYDSSWKMKIIQHFNFKVQHFACQEFVNISLTNESGKTKTKQKLVSVCHSFYDLFT